jgi:hypothetical protein
MRFRMLRDTVSNHRKGSGIGSDKQLKESDRFDLSILCENKAECLDIKRSITESDHVWRLISMGNCADLDT